MNSHVEISNPTRHVDAWGRLCEVNRQRGIQFSKGIGVQWSITFYSDFRCRLTQSWAVQALDSVASSALWSLDEKPQDCVAMNTSTAVPKETKTDAVYPPWKDPA